MPACDVVVRNYEDEDLPLVYDLYRDRSASHPHFSRDKAIITHILNSPGVIHDSRFVSFVGSRLTGLAIVAINDRLGIRQGSVIEFEAKDNSSATALLRAAEDYCQRVGVDVILVSLPPWISGCNVAGWRKIKPSVLMSKVLAAKPLITACLRATNRNRPRGTAVFDVGGERVVISMTEAGVDVSDSYPTDTASIKTIVMLSQQDFLAIVAGKISPLAALLTGKARISRITGWWFAFRLLNCMKLPTPLHTSLIDRL